ncbi:MAG: alpha-glucosidase C-terminal domain-containing protein [Anaerolineaceae bacterium]|nr:alpha-glucosidase C-terminal domain-containing protein [Anaerolineaceae bacterium]
MSENKNRISELTTKLYGQSEAFEILDQIYTKLNQFRHQFAQAQADMQVATDMTEKDALLITYGDQFSAPDQTPLESLAVFLNKSLQDVVSGVHILPFFPYSSDDGFAVIDYSEVDPQKGTWQDIADLEDHFKLMFDLVANHISSQSDWFIGFLDSKEPYINYFMVQEPTTNLSSVVRPRATPILTPFETVDGLKYTWTTFGVDQIDLNYQNPQVLLEMIDILLFYVSKGANFIRLDAIAYLWKIPGTSCIHLKQTHTVVKLFRAILDEVAEHVLLITETNVPHQENISYFGNYINKQNRTDEAQLVYQFPLAPLILHTFLTGNASILTQWANNLPDLNPGTSFFNFTASHDGIGIRPAENLLGAQQIQALVARTLRHGGRVSYKNNSDGTQSAYELNITWFDALNNIQNLQPKVDVARFLASQTIMLSLAGVPGIYIHSLFGSRNCLPCVEETGRYRSINREKFLLAEINAELKKENSLKFAVFSGYRKLLAVRKQQPAFHPAAEQKILSISEQVFAVLRIAENREIVLCLINVTDQDIKVMIPCDGSGIPKQGTWKDLLSEEIFPASKTMQVNLLPYQSRWMKLVS